jgi:mannosyltransferase OCH1-like enzyme
MFGMIILWYTFYCVHVHAHGYNHSYVQEGLMSEIPLNIFQTWSTKQLPPYMKQCVESVKQENPEFEHYLFDDHDCLQFLRTHYDTDVVHAYQTLKPGAFKADLWRYCILYTYGGIYLDIKYHCVDGFKLITMTDDEYFVCDDIERVHQLAVHNAFMVTKPNNQILYKCIQQIVKNVQMKFYGTDSLQLTGPLLMIQYFTPEEKEKLQRLHYVHNNAIAYKDTIILQHYPEYREEQRTYGKTKHYGLLWQQRECYEESSSFQKHQK